MPSVGSYLRDLREARGVSLEELARITKVGTGYLQALETDDHARLPAAVFTRGFIRAYCQALGASPDEAIAAYRLEAPDGEAPEPVTIPGASRYARASRRGPVVVSAVLVVVLGVALVVVAGSLRRGREVAAPAPARTPAAPLVAPVPPAAPVAAAPVGPPAGAAPAPPPAAVAPAAPVAPPVPASPPALVGPTPLAPAATYRLVARAAEPTWVRVRLQEGSLVEETIPAGQTREWRSSAPITLTVGNAGGIALELNGEALPSLGARGAVVRDVRIPTLDR